MQRGAGRGGDGDEGGGGVEGEDGVPEGGDVGIFKGVLGREEGGDAEQRERERRERGEVDDRFCVRAGGVLGEGRDGAEEEVGGEEGVEGVDEGVLAVVEGEGPAEEGGLDGEGGDEEEGEQGLSETRLRAG